jgi:hypothetical protein
MYIVWMIEGRLSTQIQHDYTISESARCNNYTAFTANLRILHHVGI